jgi:hypothetical protein
MRLRGQPVVERSFRPWRPTNAPPKAPSTNRLVIALQVRLFFGTASMSPPIEKPDSNRQIIAKLVTANGINASKLAL